MLPTKPAPSTWRGTDGSQFIDDGDVTVSARDIAKRLTFRLFFFDSF